MSTNAGDARLAVVRARSTIAPLAAHSQSEGGSRTLRPKLLLPHAPTDLVARPRLLARLDGGLDRKLTVIAAPAGYGKTTLLAHWLRAAPRPAAYLALDEYDADPTSFVAAVVAALAPLDADFGRDTL